MQASGTPLLLGVRTSASMRVVGMVIVGVNVTMATLTVVYLQCLRPPSITTPPYDRRGACRQRRRQSAAHDPSHPTPFATVAGHRAWATVGYGSDGSGRDDRCGRLLAVCRWGDRCRPRFRSS